MTRGFLNACKCILSVHIIILHSLDIFIYISIVDASQSHKRQQQQQHRSLLIEPMIMAFVTKYCTTYRIRNYFTVVATHTCPEKICIAHCESEWASTTADKCYIDPTTKYEWRYQIAIALLVMNLIKIRMGLSCLFQLINTETWQLWWFLLGALLLRRLHGHSSVFKHFRTLFRININQYAIIQLKFYHNFSHNGTERKAHEQNWIK